MLNLGKRWINACICTFGTTLRRNAVNDCKCK
jgi:hypothetical protein